MTRCFLDTSYLIALAASDDAMHAKAMSWRARLPRDRVTTDFVLMEVADAFASSGRRPTAILLISTLRRDRRVQIHRASPELVDAGLELFAARPDKDWGLTDCISFVVMQREGITQALTADKHFEQAGFTALLK